MNKISINEIFKLRKKTGLGVMACKKALIEVNGDINKAIEILKLKGQKISKTFTQNNINNYGVVIGKTNLYNNIGSIIFLSCETDFVAKNKIFIKLAKDILEISLLCNDKNSLINYKINKNSIKEEIIHYMNILGENIELKFFEKIYSPFISCYVHHDNKIASLVGFTKYYNGIENIGKNIAMQIVATNPKWIDNDHLLSINKNYFDKNKKLDEILLYQAYIKKPKISVKEYIEEYNKNIKILKFKRFSINNKLI